VVVSPDELNEHLRTVIVAPMTTGGQPYPWRVDCRFQEQRGRIALDQLWTVDRERLVRHVGVLPDETIAKALDALAEMFAR
jgi:mRNA interferase MazF